MLSFVGLMPVAAWGSPTVRSHRNAHRLAIARFATLIALTVLARVRRKCAEPAVTEPQCRNAGTAVAAAV